MVKKKYIAPNLITAGNMFLGYLSITESIKGNYTMAILFILLAMVCDGLDGVPVSFLYALCGVMRLVKFNIINVASSEKGDFSGMPIPNAAAMVVSYIMFCEAIYETFGVQLFHINIFIAISVISASLMVSTIPFRTPDKTFAFIPKKLAVVLILALLASMYWTLDYSVFIISYTYVILNLLAYFYKRFANAGDDDTSVEEYVEIEENTNEREG